MNAALPQQATQAATAWDNPMGTDGFEFIEYAAPGPQRAMGELFERIGLHSRWQSTRQRNVRCTAQGGINFIINAEPGLVRAALRPPARPRISRDRVPGCRMPRPPTSADQAGRLGLCRRRRPGRAEIPAIKGSATA
jgi:4-hydroxyphenylpyruvate dioxygenase